MLVSGDNRLAEQVAVSMPQTRSAVVKLALDASCVRSKPREVVGRLIGEGVEQAILHRDNSRARLPSGWTSRGRLMLRSPACFRLSSAWTRGRLKSRGNTSWRHGGWRLGHSVSVQPPTCPEIPITAAVPP